MSRLKCNYSLDGCTCKVTHIDIKGFIYCESHGKQRKLSIRTRKLTKKELDILEQGQPLEKY